jgi:hypothetical protein
MTRLHGTCLLLMLSLSSLLSFGKPAQAQCAARDVLRHHPTFVDAAAGAAPPATAESADSARVWKSIQLGTFTNKTVLYSALDEADCEIGDTAEQILVAPEFKLSSTPTKLDLFAISVAELGITRKEVRLEDVLAQAKKLGFALPAAEVGPQLRLQYFDQPVGEFLEIAMAPIATPEGGSSIFVVANGGAGLLLLGDKIGPDTQFFPFSRFVFTRRMDVATVHR